MAIRSRALPLLFALTLSSPATPVINEILYRPGTGYPENTGREFVEIHNPDPTDADLSGWALTDGVHCTFPNGTVLPAGGFLIVAADPAEFTSASAPVLGPWRAGDVLSNGGETVALSMPDGAGGWTAVDEIRYAAEGDWAVSTRNTLGGWSWVTPADSGGASIERRNPDLAVDSGQNWSPSAAAGGSPGAANSCLTANVAPVIHKVKHSPAVPKSGEVVTISCQLADETPAPEIAATLFWRDASGAAPGPFQSVAMTNDGNGRFATTLGAKADKTIVEFYLQATDGSATRTWPAPTSEGQNANCIYQVDDEPDSPSAATYRLVLTAAENAAFETLAATNPQSDREFHLTFIAGHGEETTIRYQTRMRMRGQSSRNFIHKPLRISIPADQRWGDITDFSLNPKYPWIQFMGMRLVQAAGLTGGDAVPVELRRNGIESSTGSGTHPDYGMWVRIEQINGDYADRHFPTAPDVQLYRKNEGATFWSSNFTPPAHPDGVYSGWSKQSQSGRNDWQDVANFSTVWQTTAAAHFTGAAAGDARTGTWNQTAFSDEEVATLATVADLGQLARWLALMTLLNNNEHNLSNGYDNDYGGAFVSDGTHRRLQLIPHDLDNLLGKGDNPKGPTGAGLFAMTENGQVFTPLLPLIGTSSAPGNAGFREKYFSAIREFYGGLFDADTSASPYPPFHRWIDQHLGDWVPEPVRAQLKLHASQRQAFLLGSIGAPKITPPAGTSDAAHERAPAGNLRLNEVLASNVAAHATGGSYPDLIELHNTGPAGIAISGFTLADRSNEYTFPAGSGNVPAGGYRVVHSDTLGFGLSAKGDVLRLYNAADQLIDEIEFGPQLADRSVARTGGNTWALAAPTIGAANGPALALGNPAGLCLNEWAGNTRYRLSDDFVEIHNPAADPVSLAGMRLTDSIASYPARHEFPPLSFIAAGGLLEVDSDAFGFGLNGQFDSLWLTGNNGAVVDQATLVAQHADTSTGCSPDGGHARANFALPSPGLSNSSSPGALGNVLDSLRITELMYAPAGGSEYEFIEFQNIGGVPLAIGGVRLTQGIAYTFPPDAVLAPQAFIVVCRNRTSFLSRYPGAGSKLAAGAYTGSLSDSGETLALTLPSPWGLNVLRFRYSPAWHPATAGGGRSLITRDQGITHPDEWGNSETWEPSPAANGSPGTGEPPVITSPAAVAGIVGDAFAYLITATRSPASFEATGLPPGLAIDGATGLISGFPTEDGDFPVEISATNASATATLTLTLAVTMFGELHHLAWDHSPAQAYAGIPFPSVLTARDIGGRLIRDFQGNVSLAAGTDDDGHLAPAATLSSQIPSPVLITELTDEQEDQFELQNVGTLPVATAGWFVVLGDSLTNVNTRNATTFMLPAAMEPGAVLRVSDIAGAGRTYFGAAIGWNHASTNPSRGWVMLFDASARLRDFVAFGWNATQLANLSLTVSGKTVAPVAGGHWSGNGLAVGTRGVPFDTTDSWKRIGASDLHSAGNWAWAQYGTTWGATNVGLLLPWEVTYPLTVTPSEVSLGDGRFHGKLAIPQVAGGVFLTASVTGSGAARSAAFPVLLSTDADNDGLPDAWEAQHGLSGETPADAALDPDGDGQSNLAEFHAGTDPASAASVFAIRSGVLDSQGEAFTIRWPAVAGRTYRVFRSDHLDTWHQQAVIFAEQDGEQDFTAATGGLRAGFFRVTAEP